MGDLSVLQEKFSANDKVVAAIFDTKILSPVLDKNERILTIVQNIEEVAVISLFSESRPPKYFSDLSIEHIFPINKEFNCRVGDGEENNKDNSCISLTLSTQKSEVKFELTKDVRTSGFVEYLLFAADKVEAYPVELNFSWLKKYYGSADNLNGIVGSPDVALPRQLVFHDNSLGTREKRIKYEMFLKERKFTYNQSIRIFTATWNVNEKMPQRLDGWLAVDTEAPDIYAVGFQELDAITETLIFDQTPREDIWYQAVVAALDKRKKYEKVERVRLMGMMLIVFIEESLYPHVSNVTSCTVGTGIMGRLGNKGGVAVSFSLHNTSMCFVNSHLAAHVEEFERRNQDYRDICHRTNFVIPNEMPKGIKDHDQVYWIGDLNYRITELDPAAAKMCLASNNLETVLEFDQLIKQHRVHAVFSGYKEGPITFQPTYKYDPGTDNWDSSEKNRAPAWCDRILWKGEQIVQLAYRSHPRLDVSDHKPVSATFKADIQIVDLEKRHKVYEEVMKKIDKLENELIPQVAVDKTEIHFDTVCYLEPAERQLTIANTGQVAVQFEFIRKREDEAFCKPWLTVTPYSKCISPGETCDIQLEVFINKNLVYKFNSGEEKIEDILVLHLDGGKDIFITVDGSYEKSCFGYSLESLSQFRVPVRSIKATDSLKTPDSEVYYDVPKEIWFLVDHIYRSGVEEPNLFMQPGLHSELLKIRDWLDNGCVSKIAVSIHSYAEALLLLLESTAEPLIPYNLHPACLNSSSNFLQCSQIIRQLTDTRKNVFYYLCEFLREVLAHNHKNGLDIKTLAALFGAIFLREVPSKSHENQSRETRQSIDRKKANFIYHFLLHGSNN